jgi:hypothetical protein
VRAAAAELGTHTSAVQHLTNGDEAALRGMVACYSKGLPHNPLGEVDGAAYALLLRALGSGEPRDFEAVPLGGFVKLANPQAGLAFNLVGPDPSCVELEPPPRFASAEQGAELIELYWQALLRDVPFGDYEAHSLARRAAEELSALRDFRGPRAGGGRVAPADLFRGGGCCLTGSYLSSCRRAVSRNDRPRVRASLRAGIPVRRRAVRRFLRGWTTPLRMLTIAPTPSCVRSPGSADARRLPRLELPPPRASVPPTGQV